MSTKKLTALALLTTTAMILSYVESLLPSVGVPGVKLGLANIAVIFALYRLVRTVPSGRKKRAGRVAG